MVRLQSNHFNINETASKVEFHVEWQVELQGVKEVGWVDENLTQCWVRSPIFGYRMETTHLKKSLGIKKNWVFVLAYTKCGPINPNYEEYMFPSGKRLHNDFHLLRLEGSSKTFRSRTEGSSGWRGKRFNLGSVLRWIPSTLWSFVTYSENGHENSWYTE